ncbi:MAG TPA: metallophosphoesterase family protein [Patescibacteria group bacterium]|nr:metallophosphoesterase family protein [Patescibacteria group bacterium]
MRYGIFSDVHSNLEALDAVLDAYENEHIDAYLCVGDIVGYAANPNECIEKVRALAEVTVAGNHDWASVGLFSEDYFNPYAKEAIYWTRGNLYATSKQFLESLQLVYENQDLTLVHGTLDGAGNFDYMIDEFVARDSFRILHTDICFVGHLHTTGVFAKDKSGGIVYGEPNQLQLKEGDQYIVNVGSVGQPRDGNPDAAYCIYDTEKKEVRIKRVRYDTEAARTKIIKAGIPVKLGDRLLEGR